MSKTVEIIPLDKREMKTEKFKDMDAAGMSEGEAFLVLRKGKRTIMFAVQHIYRVNIEDSDGE